MFPISYFMQRSGHVMWRTATMLIGCRETLVRDRARGLVGYDVALTRRRSPVRIRPGPWYSQSVFKKKRFRKYASLLPSERFYSEIISPHLLPGTTIVHNIRSYLNVRLRLSVRWQGCDVDLPHMNTSNYFVSKMQNIIYCIYF